MPDIRDRLETGGRIADVGCGQGFSTTAMAQRFPHASVEGFDADPASIRDARAHADQLAGFVVGDATSVRDRGPYDLVLVLETLHDLPHPVQTLAAVRAALGAGGAALIVDERVADTFGSPGDEVERMMYGWSVTHCLPTQMVEQPSAALGTVLRAGTVRELASTAGFTTVDVLPVENDFFRLYRLS
jgi:2-polyprenyl-3-methyl-5-hydroxy-6-metoxy-1,4-benzoquinol methylase